MSVLADAPIETFCARQARSTSSVTSNFRTGLPPIGHANLGVGTHVPPKWLSDSGCGSANSRDATRTELENLSDYRLAVGQPSNRPESAFGAELPQAGRTQR
jgi:hypothetical protein